MIIIIIAFDNNHEDDLKFQAEDVQGDEALKYEEGDGPWWSYQWW